MTQDFPMRVQQKLLSLTRVAVGSTATLAREKSLRQSPSTYFKFCAKNLNAIRARPPVTTKAIQLTNFGTEQAAIMTGHSI